MTLNVRTFLLTVLLAVSAVAGVAQPVTLSMGSNAGSPGAVVNVDLTMTGGSQAAGLQWRLTPGTGISSVVFAASPSATAAGKGLSCNTNGANIDCVLFGMNSNLLTDGVVATAAVTISPTASVTSAALALSNVTASSAGGAFLAATGTNGLVNIAFGGVTPGNGPMTPSSGTATTRTFQWYGVSAILYTLGYIDSSNGNLSSINNCIFQYVPSTNQISLTADNGSLQPFITLGAGSLSNSKCTLNSAASSQSIVNGTLSLTLSFSFTPSFTGTWPVFVAYRAPGSNSPTWAQAGSWTLSGAQQQVATPTFSPAAGTYSSSQLVTISTTTSGASIRYTTDGSTPTSSTGTLYSGGITVASSQTLKAVAYAAGMIDSAVATAAYTINIVSGTPGNGPMTPPSGTTTTRTFQWTGVSSILYTVGYIDASNGNLSSVNNCIFQYVPSTNQISLTADNGSLQPFITLGAGSLSNSKCTLNSAASSQTVVNGTLSLTLSFSFAPSFTGTWPVFVAYRASGSNSPTWAQAGSWTVSGGQQSGTPGNGPMTPSSGTATTRTFQWTGVSSILYTLGYIDSSNGSLSSVNNCIFQYVPSSNQISLTADNGSLQPFITLGTGSLSNSKCTLNSAASSQTVVNGTLSLTLSFSFTPSFTGTWPVFVAYRSSGSNSPTWAQVGSWSVSSGQQQVATPTFSPAGGTFSSSQLVTISTSTSGVSIRYTTDGSTPTSSTGTLYSGGITVASSQTLKAIAYATGMTDSAVATAAYTINIVSGPPGNGPMTPPSGTATTRTFQWTGVSSILYTLGVIDASNGNLSFSNSCAFQYVPSTNQISLTADNGSMQPFITLGAGSLSNSRCTLNSAASSKSVVNGTLNLTLTFSFAPSFTGTSPVFVAYRAAGSDSPTWAQVGSWTR